MSMSVSSPSNPFMIRTQFFAKKDVLTDAAALNMAEKRSKFVQDSKSKSKYAAHAWGAPMFSI